MSNAPARPPFVIGITGNVDPEGYQNGCLDRSDCPELREKIRAVFDWIFHIPAEERIDPRDFLDPYGGKFPASTNGKLSAEIQEELLHEPGGKFFSGSHWRALGLGKTPVVLLSSLAPGIDTLIVEEALNSKSHQGKIFVRAPLPFPLHKDPAVSNTSQAIPPPSEEVFRRCSSFWKLDPNASNPQSVPEVDTRLDGEKLKRLDALLTSIRSQEGFAGDRDIFAVTLDGDLESDPETDLWKIAPDGKKARDLRYRAAGEYIANQCQLLIAIYDVADAEPGDKKPDLYDLTRAGSSAVVEAMRRGLTYELLKVANNFAWVDNGPVLRIPIRRQSPKSPGARPAHAPEWKMLYPYDIQPDPREHPGTAKMPDDDPVWVKAGDQRFRRMVKHLNEFNAVELDRYEDRELFKIILGGKAAKIETLMLEKDRWNPRMRTDLERRSIVSLLGADRVAAIESVVADKPAWDAASRMQVRREAIAAELGGKGAEFVKELETLAAMRCRASGESSKLDEMRSRLLLKLILLVAFAAMAFGAFEHWHSAGDHQPPKPTQTTHESPHPHGTHSPQPTTFSHYFSPPGEAMEWTQVVLLALALAALLLSGHFYHQHLVKQRERRRYDLRALSEGLRVQIFWKLAGTRWAVTADYMQRQRGEMDWIRHAIGALSFPMERWERRFAQLPFATRLQLLKITRERWIASQKDYFDRRARDFQEEGHRCHVRGWSLAAAGLISIIFMLVGEFMEELLAEKWLEIALYLALAAVCIFYAWDPLRHGGNEEHESEEVDPPRYFAIWLLARPAIWGRACGIAALIIGLPHLLCLAQVEWPDWHNWWTIFTGAALLGGGLCLAWAERNLYSEQSLQYRAMRELFACGDRRLKALIERLAKTEGRSSEYQRLLQEIHDLLHELGCEALDENAEWLFLHRARPLEPFMGG